MKFSFSAYAFLAAALVASVSAVNLPDPADLELSDALESEDLDLFEEPDLSEFDDGKRRHLTSSEDQPTPPPVSEPQGPPVLPPDSDGCDYDEGKAIRLFKKEPDDFAILTTNCDSIVGFPIKKIKTLCRYQRLKNNCPGLCDVDKCPCANNPQVVWTKTANDAGDNPDITIGDNTKKFTCNYLSNVSDSKKARLCRKPKWQYICRGICKPDTCPQVATI